MTYSDDLLRAQMDILRGLTAGEAALKQETSAADQAHKKDYEQAVKLLDLEQQKICTARSTPDQASLAQLIKQLNSEAEARVTNLNAAAQQQQTSRLGSLEKSYREVSSSNAQLGPLVSAWLAEAPPRKAIIPTPPPITGSPEQKLAQCVELAAVGVKGLNLVGSPGQYGHGNRSGASAVGDGVIGGLGAVIGALGALIFIGGIPAIVVTAIIAWIISASTGANFWGVVITILVIIAGIGLLIGMLGWLETDEQKAQRRLDYDCRVSGMYAARALNSATSEAERVITQLRATMQKDLDQARLKADEVGKDLAQRVVLFGQRCQADFVTHANALAAAQQKFERNQEDMRRRVADLTRQMGQLGLIVADWSDPCWNDYTPLVRSKENGQQVTCIRAGILSYSVGGAAPALLPFPANIFIKSNTIEEEKAHQVLRTLVSRMVFTIPVFSAKYIFIDPAAAGNFLFADLPAAMGNFTYSDPYDIEEQTRDLEKHMTLMQNQVAGFANFEEYNSKARVPEPYRILCIANYPERFDQSAYQRLENIARFGKKVGIYMIVQAMTDRLPYDMSLSSLFSTGCVIDISANTNTLTVDRAQLQFAPDQPPDKAENVRLSRVIREQTRDSASQKINFDDITLDDEHWWQKKPGKYIEAPIGISGARDELTWWLGAKDENISAHALVGGRTGSGKSNLLNVFITNIAMLYSPNDVEMYLLDFKQGVEFLPYARYNLPHARVIAIESEREFGLSVLLRLEDEINQRAIHFKRYGIEKIEEYSPSFEPHMPRILIIFDEYQMMFEQNDMLAQNAIRVIDRIARQGRSYGIHLILGSQTGRVSDITSNTYDQFATRILFVSSENVAGGLLTSDNVSAARSLQKPGDVLYNAQGGDKHGNVFGRVAHLQRDEMEKRLIAIRDFAASKHYQPPFRTIVFQGGESSRLEENERLDQLYAERLETWPDPQQVRTLFNLKDWGKRDYPALAWLGEAIEIKPHTAAAFRKRNRSNLLIVGEQEEIAFGMLSSTLLSLPAFYRPDQLQMVIIDLSHHEEEWADTCEQFETHFGLGGIGVDIIVVEAPGALDLIERMHTRVQERKAKFDDGLEENEPVIYFILGGMQRIPRLRPAVGEFGPEVSPYAKKLQFILEHGPELNVHTILWSDNIRNFDTILDHSTLTHFNRRVALQMSEADSNLVLNDIHAAKLNSYRAILYDEEGVVPYEKFKPYTMPTSSAERETMIATLAQKLYERSRRNRMLFEDLFVLAFKEKKHGNE